jgi:hypothetical protein
MLEYEIQSQPKRRATTGDGVAPAGDVPATTGRARIPMGADIPRNMATDQK